MALQLIRAGYTQVSVVRGGFRGLVEAGVAVTPKPQGEAAQSGQQGSGAALAPGAPR